MIIQSVWRALTILSLFTRQRTQIGITEISQVLGVTKGAAHSLVATLVHGGFLVQDPQTKKYKLGLKVFEIAMIQPQTQELNQRGVGPATELANAYDVVTRLSIWDQDAMLVTSTYYPRHRPELSSSVGPRLRAHCTAMGKCVLAHRPAEELERFLAENELKAYTHTTITDPDRFRAEIAEIRRLGYALCREEAILGVFCLGAPVFGAEGAAIGAVSLSGPPERILEPKYLQKLSLDLMRAAETISRGLGSPPMARPLPARDEEAGG